MLSLLRNARASSARSRAAPELPLDRVPSKAKHAYNRRMPVFMCRWPNGDLSFVSARNREDAIITLDELDNAEIAELRQVRDFMVDFRLTDRGDLELQSFG